jgi:nicotinamide-nucleotide amidase
LSAAGDDSVRRVAELLSERRWRAAVAESLTAGHLAAALGAGDDAASWLAGGVVAYMPDVKFNLLGVTPGPVITRECARQMATGVAKLMRADVALGVTGCGGPDPEEGRPPGTVFIATSVRGRVDADEFMFAGPPDDVLASTIEMALDLMVRAISSTRS